MTTLLLLIGILLGVWWLLGLLAGRRPGWRLTARDRGAAALAALLAFTGAAHFFMTEQMALLLPFWVPRRELLVWGSGVAELVLALALLVPRLRRAAGWLTILMLALFLPVNVWAAWNKLPLGGHGWGWPYLLVRVPFQLALMAWAWGFAARRPAGDDRA